MVIYSNLNNRKYKMITLVVIFNTLLALVNFYIAWRVWKIRRVLAGATKAILAADRNTYNVLHPAPLAIAKGQKGTLALRNQYGKLQTQLQQLVQILALIRLGLGVLGRRRTKFDSNGAVRSRQRASGISRPSRWLKKILAK
jgi:hypothetical protein